MSASQEPSQAFQPEMLSAYYKLSLSLSRSLALTHPPTKKMFNQHTFSSEMQIKMSSFMSSGQELSHAFQPEMLSAYYILPHIHYKL